MESPTFADKARSALLVRVLAEAITALAVPQREKFGRQILRNLRDAARSGALEIFLVACCMDPPLSYQETPELPKDPEHKPPPTVLPAPTPGPTIEPLPYQVRALKDFVTRECEGDFDEFVGAVLALGWFENFDRWSTWKDIPEADADRAYKGRELLARTIKTIQRAEPDDIFGKELA